MLHTNSFFCSESNNLRIYLIKYERDPVNGLSGYENAENEHRNTNRDLLLVCNEKRNYEVAVFYQ
jgi:hypothetical protein